MRFATVFSVLPVLAAAQQGPSARNQADLERRLSIPGLGHVKEPCPDLKACVKSAAKQGGPSAIACGIAALGPEDIPADVACIFEIIQVIQNPPQHCGPCVDAAKKGALNALKKGAKKTHKRDEDEY